MTMILPKPKRKSPPSKYPQATRETLQQLQEEGLTHAEMARRLEMPRGTLAWMLAKYEMTQTHTGEPKRRRKPRPPALNPDGRPPKGAITPEVREVAVTAEQERTIRQLYKRVPRREIAKRMRLDKVTLNMMIIKLGLGS